MCDQDHFEDDLKKYSRRNFNAIATAGVGAAMMLPRAIDAAEVSDRDVTIETPDGQCDAYFVAPQTGSHAAVLVWPDIFGLRPAFRQMGKRLAESGYSVLVVNPFYRTQKAPTAPQGVCWHGRRRYHFWGRARASPCPRPPARRWSGSR